MPKPLFHVWFVLLATSEVTIAFDFCAVMDLKWLQFSPSRITIVQNQSKDIHIISKDQFISDQNARCKIIMSLVPCRAMIQFEMKTTMPTDVIPLNGNNCLKLSKSFDAISTISHTLLELLRFLKVSSVVLVYDNLVISMKEVNELLDSLQTYGVSGYLIEKNYRYVCGRPRTSQVLHLSCFSKPLEEFDGALVVLSTNSKIVKKDDKWPRIPYIITSAIMTSQGQQFMFDANFLFVVRRNIKQITSSINSAVSAYKANTSFQNEQEKHTVPEFTIFMRPMHLPQNIIREFGTWDRKNNLVVKNKNFRRSTFENSVLRIVSVTRSPSQILEPNGNGTYEASGPIFDAVKTMSKMFNFSYVVYSPADNQFGKLLENGNWNGMIGLLLNESLKMDFAAALFTVTRGRTEVIDFSSAYLTQGYGILQINSKKRQISNALFAPFSVAVWIILIISICLIGPILSVMCYIQRKLLQHSIYNERNYTLGDFCWFAFGSFCKQGTNLNPDLNSTRTMFAVWWLFCLLITSFYSANLTAYLTVNSGGSPINDIYDVLKIPEITWMVKSGDAIEDMIQRGGASPFDELKTSLQNGRGIVVKSDEEAVTHVLSGSHVYLRENSVLENLRKAYYKDTSRCDLGIAPKQFLTRDFAFAFPKKSQIKSALDTFVKRGRESGFLGNMIQTDSSSDPCSIRITSQLVDAKTLDIFDMMILFVGLLGGLTLSCLTVFLENLWKKYKSRNRISDVSYS